MRSKKAIQRNGRTDRKLSNWCISNIYSIGLIGSGFIKLFLCGIIIKNLALYNCSSRMY